MAFLSEIRIGDKMLESIAEWQSGLGTAMANLGEFTRRRIVARTLSGRDRFGSPFKAYDDKYARWKRVGPGDVTLNLSGEMLSAMQVQDENGTRFDPRTPPAGGGSPFRAGSGAYTAQDDIRLQVGFGSNARAARKAALHEFGQGRMPVRQFMGLEELEVEEGVNNLLLDMGQIQGTREDVVLAFDV